MNFWTRILICLLALNATKSVAFATDIDALALPSPVAQAALGLAPLASSEESFALEVLLTSATAPPVLLPATNHNKQEAIHAPEPTSLSLLAVGLGMIALAKRRSRWLR